MRSNFAPTLLVFSGILFCLGASFLYDMSIKGRFYISVILFSGFLIFLSTGCYVWGYGLLGE